MADEKSAPAPKGPPQFKIYLGPNAGNGLLRHGQHIEVPMPEVFQDFFKANPQLGVPNFLPDLEGLSKAKKSLADY